jgi:hypothetical protein
MKQEVRILLGLLVFYLVYILFVDFTKLSSIPLIIVAGIFIIYLFLPDISNENNMVNKHQKNISILLFIAAIIVFIITKLLLVPLIIIGCIFVLVFLTTSPSIYKSLTTGLYLSAPLFFLSPFYFLFAFLGFFTFWVASRI